MNMNRLHRRARAFLSRGALEREMDEEMRFHLEMEVEDRVRSGMTREEAMRTTLRDFGGIERFKEEARDVRGTRVYEDLMQDLRYGMRVLFANRGFSAVVILTLAIGIGATTAVFSLVNGVLLKPLPYPESDRLVMMREIEKNGQPNWAAHPNFVDWREQAESFEAMASAEWPDWVTVLGATEPTRALAMGVSREFFQLARVQPMHGRAILPEENRKGGAATAVVSQGFWEQYLGADRNLAAHTLDLNGETYQVVGVMPAGFRLLGDVSIWLPYERNPNENRMSHAYRIVGRLADGVSIDQARREMTHLAGVLRDVYGKDNTRATDVYVKSLHEESVGGSRQSLLLLLGAAGLLLLVACTNVASTLLARGMVRHQEIAIRASIGATRLRIIRQLFAESALLAAAGGVLGILLAYLAVKGLVVYGAGSLPRLGEVSVSLPVLVFTTLVTLVAAVLFGLLPSVRLSEGEISGVLRAGTRGTTTGRQRMWRVLVATEIAMAAMLLIGAGLLVRSLWTILEYDTGYSAAGVVAVDLSLPPTKYADSMQIQAFYDRALAEIGAAPGVTSVGMTSILPLRWGSMTANASREGMDPEEEPPTAGWRVVSPAYFETLQVPLRDGRMFTHADRAGSGDVAIVNESLAETLWPGRSAVGQRVRIGFDPRGAWLTVIGVVGEMRNWDASVYGYRPYEVYVPYTQRPESAGSMVLVVRTRGKPSAIVSTIRERIRGIDADVPVEFEVLRDRIDASASGRRFTMLLLVSFGVAALVLAAVGIYGVVSYTVARQTREIGIRLALGAQPRDVRRRIQRNAVVTTAMGLAVGIAGAAMLGRILSSMLFQVNPRDPATYVVVAALLLGTAALASFLPARRSTRVDPMITMRAD